MKSLKQIANSAWKKMKSIGLSAGIASVLVANVYADNDLYFSPFAELTPGITLESSIIGSIDNIPLEIRDVPGHPDDLQIRNHRRVADPENVAPIAEDNVEFMNRLSILDTKIGWRYAPLGGYIFAAGVGADFSFDATPYLMSCRLGNPDPSWFLDTSSKNHRKDIRERNYRNYPGTEERGIGAALTYYYIHPEYLFDWNTTVRPYLFSRIEVGEKRDLTLIVGYDAYMERIVAENGWDRYAVLDEWKRYDLADLIVGRPHILITNYKDEEHIGPDEYNYFSLIFGASHLINNNIKGLGKEMDIKFNNPAFFVGLVFVRHFVE